MRASRRNSLLVALSLLALLARVSPLQITCEDGRQSGRLTAILPGSLYWASIQTPDGPASRLLGPAEVWKVVALLHQPLNALVLADGGYYRFQLTYLWKREVIHGSPSNHNLRQAADLMLL